jgi:hypothetical protein
LPSLVAIRQRPQDVSHVHARHPVRPARAHRLEEPLAPSAPHPPAHAADPRRSRAAGMAIAVARLIRFLPTHTRRQKEAHA